MGTTYSSETHKGYLSSEVKRAGVQDTGYQRLDPRLQARLRQGVNYNLKILLRGGRRAGKSTLLAKLRGKAPEDFDEYRPTSEIVVAHAHWRNDFTNEVVKLEAWDVVDIALADPRDGKEDLEQIELERAHALDEDTPAGLAGSHLNLVRQATVGSIRLATLDARRVDVYRDTDGVVIMYNPFIIKTWECALETIKALPGNIPCIVVRNLYDVEEAMKKNDPDDFSQSRCGIEISVQEALEQIKKVEIDMGMGSSRDIFQHICCSMKNSFGLEVLYQFFNVSFLKKRRKMLLAQVRLTEEHLEQVSQNLAQSVLSQDYAQFKVEAKQGATESIAKPGAKTKNKIHSQNSRQSKRNYCRDIGVSGQKDPPETPAKGLTMQSETSQQAPIRADSKTRLKISHASLEAHEYGVSKDLSHQSALEKFLGEVDSDDDDGFYADQKASRQIVEKYLT